MVSDRMLPCMCSVSTRRSSSRTNLAMGAARVDSERQRHPGRVRKGSHLDRLGLPTGGGALLRTPTNDATHIAQVVGRMVRQPLARRIATDDALNTVACFLPNFNRTALGVIKAELEDIRHRRRHHRRRRRPTAKVFGRSSRVPVEAFNSSSHSRASRHRTPREPLARARTLAKLLTDSASGIALLPGAGAQLTRCSTPASTGSPPNTPSKSRRTSTT